MLLANGMNVVIKTIKGDYIYNLLNNEWEGKWGV